MTGHTEGPWHRNIPPASHYPTIFAGRNIHVARIVPNGLPEDQIEANANLIASAPETAAERDQLKATNAELLEALTSLVKRSPFVPVENGIQATISMEQIAQANAAIASAANPEG